MPERVITCIGAKGGVGKSTIAISLSVCATNCLLVDTDPQLSAGNWYREREAELPEPGNQSLWLACHLGLPDNPPGGIHHAHTALF